MNDSFFSAITKQSQLFYRTGGGAIGLLVVAIWILVPTMTDKDEIEPFAVRKLEKGATTETRWIETSGRMLWDECGVEEGISETFMIPIVSAAWREGDPVAVFVKMSSFEAAKYGEADFGKFNGMLSMGGMPSDWRQFFNDETNLKIAANHVMINYGKTPGRERNTGLLCLTGSWLLGIISIFSFSSEAVTVSPGTATTPQYSIDHTPAVSQMQPEGSAPESPLSPDVANAVSHSVDDDVKNWMASRGING